MIRRGPLFMSSVLSASHLKHAWIGLKNYQFSGWVPRRCGEMLSQPTPSLMMLEQFAGSKRHKADCGVGRWFKRRRSNSVDHDMQSGPSVGGSTPHSVANKRRFKSRENS